MKRFLLLVGSVTALLSMGANGRGCSLEVAPSDGSSSTWATGEVPTPEATTRPMTDAWLAENCWTQMVDEALACAGTAGQTGDFDDDRQTCTYDSGARLLLGGPIGTPAKDSTSIPVVEWRVVGGAGRPCATGKILSPGRTIVDVGGRVALFENVTLTKYRVTCPDGKTYGNQVDGTAPSFGALWLAKRTPGVLFSCDGTKQSCTLELWGSKIGPAEIATCE
jgi:hypothetical protein